MKILSWGRSILTESKFINFTKENTNEKNLYVGNLRSYGDSCLNNENSVVSMLNFDNILEFNETESYIDVQAGITFDQLLQFLVPKGFFLPVTPGTKLITVGGAIANDVHGKNHESAGSFGNFVTELELLESTGEQKTCSHSSNNELFKATIGGLGLTGCIKSARFKLKKIPSSFLDVETIKFHSLAEFIEINKSSSDYPYTVAWLDCLTQSKSQNKDHAGLYMRGDWSTKTKSLETHQTEQKLVVPFNLPSWCCNSFNMKLFNFGYFNKQRIKTKKILQHYEPFFYPLDGILNWNKIYGEKGFYQFQCVLPGIENTELLKALLDIIVKSKQGSFLSVIKTFGEIESVGMLSFPKEGITLCLDFPNNGRRVKELYRELEDFVVTNNGRMYPAKDCLMQSNNFKKFYPNFEEFKQYKDPNITSDFWKRVTK